MLATLHDKAFDDENWVYEIKWDGYRAITELNGKEVRFYSRNGISFANEYTTLYDELRKLKIKAVLDGEVVALDEQQKASFQNLQRYQQDENIQLVYYVFDILSLKGKSVENKPLLERKGILQQLLPSDNPFIRYCDHIEGKGKAFFEALKTEGLEGMIAKRADSVYREGTRSSDWLKVKHMQTEEAIIAGYTAPRSSRKYFGALVLGTYKDGRLEYIGHTGTGFTEKTLKEVYQQLQPLVTDTNPFGKKVRLNAPVTWVKPELVCNLKFTEVTKEGNRRHPVFTGLRKDKAPEEVSDGNDSAPDTDKTKTQVTRANMTGKTIAGNKATLSNLDKIYWPGEGYTKGDLLDYYDKVYPFIIKHLKGRPQSLKRNPNGINGPSFFHKDAGEHVPDWMSTFPVWSDSTDKTIDYLVCNNKSSLLYIANLGCIEINPWNSTVDSPDRPDYLVLDIDPSDNNTFDQVIECALVIKEVLDEAGVSSYCKTSGATGLHVYVPLGAKYTYEQARQFSELVATLAQERLPAFTTLERSLSKRGKNRIYIDYLQNKQGATLSCAYSVRPKPGATVSAPLDWKEVKAGLSPQQFHMKNMLQRLERKGDLFLPVLKKGVDLLKALKKWS